MITCFDTKDDSIPASQLNLTKLGKGKKKREKEKQGDQSIKVGNLSFSKKNCIGSGHSGREVYGGQKEDGTKVAIKRISRNSLKNTDFKNDLKHLRDLNIESKNIVEYMDLEEDEGFYYLAVELCKYNLKDYIDGKTAKKKVVKEMLHGLQALHTAGVIHCALKPSNILIDSCNTAKLTDYGISCKMKKKWRCTVDRQSWEANEILNETEESHTKSSDIQVAGMLVYYILSYGEHPFGNKKKRKENIKNGKYSLEHVEDEQAKDLIEWMINKEPKNRPTIDEVLDHPFFLDESVERLQRNTCNLEEYMAKINQEISNQEKNAQVIAMMKVMWEMLHDLKTHHTAGVTYCDLKPSNILIDSCNTAKLADYGISCKLKKRSAAETQSWEATEILNKTEETHTKSSDIQVAGMLVYYILSYGEHPFGNKKKRKENIMNGKYSLEHVEDEQAKDLIEWMINKEPKNRLTIDDVLDHPFFWDNRRKVQVLRKMADIEEVQVLWNCKINEELEACVKKHSEGKTFSEWKSKISWKSFGPNLPEDLLGLLLFLRIILLQEEMFLIEKTFDRFPDFFISLYKLAKDMKWEY